MTSTRNISPRHASIPHSAEQAVRPAEANEQDTAEQERALAASHEPALGTELHPGVFVGLLLGYAWMLIVVWLTFASGGHEDLDLSIVSVILVVIFGLTSLAFATARHHVRPQREHWFNFIERPVQIATGRLPGKEVAIQILLIPGAVAIMAMIFAFIYGIERPS